MNILNILNMKNLLIAFALLIAACTSNPEVSELSKLKGRLSSVSNLDIVVVDVQKGDSLLGKYIIRMYDDSLKTHRDSLTSWLWITGTEYYDHKNYIGETVYKKRGGSEAHQLTVQPVAPTPSVQTGPDRSNYNEFVGNTDYGDYVKRDDGTEFWQFYAQHQMLNDLLDDRDERYYRSATHAPTKVVNKTTIIVNEAPKSVPTTKPVVVTPSKSTVSKSQPVAPVVKPVDKSTTKPVVKSTTTSSTPTTSTFKKKFESKGVERSSGGRAKPSTTPSKSTTSKPKKP